jgi:subtilisin family serine protease
MKSKSSLKFDSAGPNDADLDDHGHGTHVAGVIAAKGNTADGNQAGVGAVGVNWQSSIMPLKFLDEDNTGNLVDAICAVNYVTMMRETHNVNVRVVNSSWTTTFRSGLEDAIREAGKQEILIVAGAGNGDAFGNASDIDRFPVYPASYDLDNIISVTATGQDDEIVPYFNYGRRSVDLAAPGLKVYSTQLSNGNGHQSGTSFSTAFVSGAAALVLSNPATPDYVTVEELRAAILSEHSVDPLPLEADRELVATRGRLNAHKALQVDTIAPRATLLRGAEDGVARVGTSREVEVQYTDNRLVSRSTVDDDDIVVCLQVSGVDCLTDSNALRLTTSLKTVNPASDSVTLTATYEITPPDGNWDPSDNGTY